MFHVGQLSASEVIRSGPFHYNILDFKSATNFPVVGMSAGLSFVLIYLKTTSGSDLISSMQFLMKLKSGLLFLIQFSTHCESVHIIFLSIFKWISFATNFIHLIPIKTASSSNRGKLMEFFGASFVCEYSRCLEILPELVAYASLEASQNPNNQQFLFPAYLGTAICVMPSKLLHSFMVTV